MPNVRTPRPSSKYYLPKHRYLTAYHYALQYQEWKDEYRSIGDDGAGLQIDPQPHGTKTGNPTETKAIRRAELKDKFSLIESICEKVAPEIKMWLLRGVTVEGTSYIYLRQMMRIPCGRDYYYDRRRAFYYELSNEIEKQ